jgi:hypothetical protein
LAKLLINIIFYPENLKGRNHLGDLDINGKPKYAEKSRLSATLFTTDPT